MQSPLVERVILHISHPRFIAGTTCWCSPYTQVLRICQNNGVYTNILEKDYYVLEESMVIRLALEELQERDYLKSLQLDFASTVDEWRRWQHIIMPQLLVDVAKKRHKLKQLEKHQVC